MSKGKLKHIAVALYDPTLATWSPICLALLHLCLLYPIHLELSFESQNSKMIYISNSSYFLLSLDEVYLPRFHMPAPFSVEFQLKCDVVGMIFTTIVVKGSLPHTYPWLSCFIFFRTLLRNYLFTYLFIYLLPVYCH